MAPLLGETEREALGEAEGEDVMMDEAEEVREPADDGEPADDADHELVGLAVEVTVEDKEALDEGEDRREGDCEALAVNDAVADEL